MLLSQWCHSIANIKIYKAVTRIFKLALTVSQILACETVDLVVVVVIVEKICQGHGLQLSQWQLSMAPIKIYKSCIVHFCARFNRFRDISI